MQGTSRTDQVFGKFQEGKDRAMAKWDVTLTTVASTTVHVEAETQEAAYEAAQMADMPRPGHQCAGGGRYNGQGLELGDVWEIPAGEKTELYIQQVAP